MVTSTEHHAGRNLVLKFFSQNTKLYLEHFEKPSKPLLTLLSEFLPSASLFSHSDSRYTFWKNFKLFLPTARQWSFSPRVLISSVEINALKCRTGTH